MINRFLFISILLFISVLLFPENRELYRYGIFVSSSKGYNEHALPDAAKEARQVAALFKEYCYLETAIVLEDPDVSELNRAFDRAKEISREQGGTGESQFFFYYYGHGLSRGLLLDHEVYSKELLKKKAAAIEADLKVFILDACSSQILGDDKTLDFTTGSKGTVFVSSSSIFQKAYVGVFTPVLKAGLMGDADGFIPRRVDAYFFYNEITGALDPAEASFVRSLYGLSDYYTYTEPRQEEGRRIQTIYESLGKGPVPPRIHISVLENEILNRIGNSVDEKSIMAAYGYTRNCILKKDISGAEKERLLTLLEKAGFRSDNYVTLRELFSYLYSGITEKKINGQKPTINTSLLTLSRPVRFSYMKNKVSLFLAYPGTILIKKVKEPGVLETVVKLIPGLDAGEPVHLALEPGNYTLFVETDRERYTIPVELKTGQEPLFLEELSWENLTAYREGGLWQEKAVPDKKLRINRITAWVPPAVTFTLFAAPLSLLFSGIYYNYDAQVLYDKYNNETNPAAIIDLREQIDRQLDIRNYLYIAAGICFALPVAPFIVWMVRIAQSRKLKKEAEKLKKHFSANCLPEFSIGPDSFGLGLHIKL